MTGNMDFITINGNEMSLFTGQYEVIGSHISQLVIYSDP